MLAIRSTCKYETRKYSAMRNAAAPSVGGDRMAPMPDAASMAPAVFAVNPARRSMGHAIDPSVTVVATPEPETVPRRNPASETERPVAAGDCDFPDRDNDQSRKNVPAPEASSTAP